MTKERLACAPEVAAALEHGAPVVAFETTILSFGLPQPVNAQVAAECEEVARAHGVVPATAAILGGRVRLGLSADEIAWFCTRDPSIRKVNLQNFAAVLASGGAGALTVAASMQACALGGVRVFATGGIGGVHRGFARTLDFSSDLTALGRFPVAVVCAGAKSILDVPATLEALETLGVPVVGYRTGTFPLFFTPRSRHRLEVTFDEMEPLARFVRLHMELSGTGVLVVTPVPEEEGLSGEEIERWTAEALAEAEPRGIAGKEVTPFLLARLEELSQGRTLQANRALVVNNARAAARLAVELAR